MILGTVIASRSWRGDDRRSILMSFSFAIIMTLATSYYANAYDLTLLLLPLFLIGGTFLRGSNWEGLKDRVWPRLLFLGAAAVLLCAPVSWVLALHVDQFCWMALTLFALAVSLSAAEGHPQRASL